MIVDAQLTSFFFASGHNGMKNMSSYIDNKVFLMCKKHGEQVESGTDDGSHEWLNGFRGAHRNSSSDPSTGPDNGIPGAPRVDGWDARLGAACGGEQEKKRYVCVLWLCVDRSHQRQLRGFTTDPLIWRGNARQCRRMSVFGEPWTVCEMSPHVCHL